MSLYTIGPNGQVTRTVAFATPDLPTSLATAELTGNGLFDLIAANALADTVTIALQTAPGVFAAPISVPAGDAPSAITTGIFTGDGLTDIAVTDQASGRSNCALERSQARLQPVTPVPGEHQHPRSDPDVERPQRHVIRPIGQPRRGYFTAPATKIWSCLIKQRTASRVLVGDGSGGFFNPEPGLTTSTSDGLSINDRPIAIVAGDFTEGGRLDLAVLMEDTGEIWIYTGNGNGTFQHTFSIPVGEEATGLTVVPGNGAGLFNLLVGNRFGDVLILVGRGDGTFQIAGEPGFDLRRS